MALGYDRSAAAHWVAGVRPAPHIAALIVEALSRKLGRPVTTHDAGLASASQNLDHGLSAVPMSGAVTDLVELWSADGDPVRRTILHDLAYSLSAVSSVPAWSQAGKLPRAADKALPGARIGLPQVQAVQSMTELFYRSDIAFGSGGIRRALTAYLSGDVAVWLRAPASTAVHRKLLSAVSELVYLSAFMCFDSGLQGLAQRYYLEALSLAREAQDPGAYATVLRGMSVQAHMLGHHDVALRLADSAAQARGSVSGTSAAFLCGQLALACAATRDRRGALEHLGAAERYLQASTDGGDTLGTYHPAALARQRAEVLVAAGDRSAAREDLAVSIHRRPAGERLPRALTVARLAELQIHDGHVEAACVSGHRFLDDWVYLHSARADALLSQLRARLRPYQASAVVRILLERMRVVSAVTSTAAWAAGFPPAGDGP
ncbi:hypothetical protein [Catenulispora rubra]|uniref:hypothetical protein n=1 Tax=Catenulispora rubra TaxID=280293 RepID=UPI0018927FBA|nr:hypothetical protein [Catenulispora rubra]